MTYCYSHNIEHTGSQCPQCIADELDALDAIKTATEDAAWKQANPGDYECPHCKYITLNRGASRCPTCNGTIDNAHWSRVFQREKEEREKRTRQLEQRAHIHETFRVYENDRKQEESRRNSLRNLHATLVVLLIAAFGSVGVFLAWPSETRKAAELFGKPLLTSILGVVFFRISMSNPFRKGGALLDLVHGPILISSIGAILGGIAWAIWSASRW